ncbi:MAG: DUF308 domain-containing protein [Clostridia bacterium]|nr:DUF308 domain-containing protein [Clostridia bacterium]
MAIATKTDRISTAPIWLRGIIFAVLELVLGIFLLIAPDNVLRIVTIIIGILLVILGLYSVFRYFSTSPRSAASGTGLSMGLAIFLVGLYLIIRSEAVAAFIITNLKLLFGIILLLLALDQLQNTVDGIRLKSHFWWIPGIPFVILTTLSLIVFFAEVEDIFRFVAILFIVSAVLTLASTLVSFFLMDYSKKEKPAADQPAPESEKKIEEKQDIQLPVSDSKKDQK